MALAGTVQYGSPIFLRADVRGSSGFGAATGNIVFTDNRNALPGDPFALNSQGNTITPFAFTTFAPGLHNIVSHYSGDASFNPSTAVPVSFQIIRAATGVNLTASSATVTQGDSVTLTAVVVTNGFGNAPTNRVFFFDGATQIGAVVPTGGFDPVTGTTTATAVLTKKLSTVGMNSITAMYHGDFNHLTSTSLPVTITVTAP